MSQYTPGEHEKNLIVGYSKYTNTEGIPDEYKKYDIFVKKDINGELIKCTFGCDPTGAPSNVAEIFPVCLSDQNKYIGKIIPYSVTPGGWTGIISEIQIQNRAAVSCKVPKIVMYFLGTEKAVIIMDKIEGDTINSKLIYIIEKAKDNQKEKIESAKREILQIYKAVKISLDKLHENEIYHGDSHLENFMYESKHQSEHQSEHESKEENEIWIIDFGHSSTDTTKKNVKILEDYMCLRSAFTILSKSKTKEGGKFVLKGYSIYLEDIIMLLNTEIVKLETCVCGPCTEDTSAKVAMRRSKRKVSRRQSSMRKSKRQSSKRKVSKRKVSKRQVSKRKVSKRKVSKRQVSKRQVSKRSRR